MRHINQADTTGAFEIGNGGEPLMKPGRAIVLFRKSRLSVLAVSLFAALSAAGLPAPGTASTGTEGDCSGDMLCDSLPPARDCTQEEEHWKDNRDAWQTDGDLCGSTWMEILDAPSGDELIRSAKPWIVTSLNFAQGASAPQEVVDAYLDLEAAIADCEISKAEKNAVNEAKNTLKHYNDGKTGPGSCVDLSTCDATALYTLAVKTSAKSFKAKYAIANFSGGFDSVDPRNGFVYNISQGSTALSLAIPEFDTGWIRKSKPHKGRFTWKGVTDGFRLVKWKDLTFRNGQIRLIIVGKYVPGSDRIDARSANVLAVVEADTVCAAESY